MLFIRTTCITITDKLNGLLTLQTLFPVLERTSEQFLELTSSMIETHLRKNLTFERLNIDERFNKIKSIKSETLFRSSDK